MVVVILVSKKLRINPDNIATPIAASLGDLITLALLSWISDKLYRAVGEFNVQVLKVVVIISVLQLLQLILFSFLPLLSH